MEPRGRKESGPGVGEGAQGAVDGPGSRDTGWRGGWACELDGEERR